MRDFLPPIFQILTGLGFFSLLLVGTLARAGIKPLSGRLIGFAIILCTLGFFLLSRATAGTSLGAGAELFAGAGACFFGAVVLLATSIFLTSRNATTVAK